MMSFEDFCRSNILHVILKYHNEGGSRDVERLTRMAYDEYMSSPHLRHIDSYYLNEIRFFPPILSSQEQILFDQHRLKHCYVDLGNSDNWCLRTERYVLLKLKRSDTRDNSVIANSKMYRVNREAMIYKYCRNKFQEAREETRRRAAEKDRRKPSLSNYEKQIPELAKDPSGSAKSGSRITDFFQKQVTNKTPQAKKMQLLRLFNNPEKNLYQDASQESKEENEVKSSSEIKLRPGPASKKRQILDQLKKKELEELDAKKPRVGYIPVETATDSPAPDNISVPEGSCPIEAQDDDMQVVREELKERGLKMRPGPKSKTKAFLERVKQKEEVIQNMAKIRPCPASKKPKYLAKTRAKEKLIEETVNQDSCKDQENIDSPNILPLPSTTSETVHKPTITVTVPTPLSEKSAVIQPPPIRAKKEPIRGSKLWLLMYGVFDPVRKCFYDPAEPPPLLPSSSTQQSPDAAQFDFSPLNVSSPMVTHPKHRPSLNTTPPSPSTPDDSHTPELPADFPMTMPPISYCQVNPMDDVDNTIDIVMERNARDILHPKLFQYPDLCRKVKNMLIDKARHLEREKEKEAEEREAFDATEECHNSPVASTSSASVATDHETKHTTSRDKLSLAASQDSFVTVIEVQTRRPTRATPRSRASVSARLMNTPQKQMLKNNVAAVTPEVILCDQMGTQPVHQDHTQPIENPLQTQEFITDQHMWVDSEVEVSTVPEEIIEIEDNSCSMVNEILGLSQSTPPQQEGEQQATTSDTLETPKKIATEAPRTPVTRSRKKKTSCADPPEVKVESGTPSPTKRRVSPRKKGTFGGGGGQGGSADTSVVAEKFSVNRVAYRYNALPLQTKKAAGNPLKIAPKGKRKQVAPKKACSEDIYTAVRFGEETDGTAAGLDIQDASLVAESIRPEEEPEVQSTLNRSKNKNTKVRTLLCSLKEIAERQKQALKRASETESRAFSAHQVASLSYKTDGKGNFYSDSCAQCSFSVNFTVDGLRRLQIQVDINRHLLNLTQDQWESFQRLLQSVTEFEYVGWVKDHRRTNGGGGDFYIHDDDYEDVGGGLGSLPRGCCIIKRALACLLKTTPKLGVNVGAIKFNTCVGAKPLFMKRMPQKIDFDLDVTECIDPRILHRLEAEVKKTCN